MDLEAANVVAQTTQCVLAAAGLTAQLWAVRSYRKTAMEIETIREDIANGSRVTYAAVCGEAEREMADAR